MSHSDSTFQHSVAVMANTSTQVNQNTKDGGVRKRNSLFSRLVDTRARERAISTLHTTMASRSILAPLVESRPSTSHQEIRRQDSTASDRERSNTDLNGSKRQSLFSGRKISLRRVKTAQSAPSSAIAEDVNEPDESTFGMLAPREDFGSEEEYDHYLRKTMISTPFNFQHVTHTHRRHIPNLHTVNEKDLTREFWATSTRQPPLPELNGIKAESVFAKLDDLGIERGAVSSRPTTPRRVLKSRRSRSELGLGTSTASDRSRHLQRQPRRTTSVNALGPVEPFEQQATSLPFILDWATLRPGLRPYKSDMDVQSRHNPIPSFSEDLSRVEGYSTQVEFRSKQPLPALPPRAPSRTAPRKSPSLKSSSPRPLMSELDARARRLEHRQSGNIWSPSLMYVPCPQNESAPSMHSNWEDDVDLAYEQAAESTCHFDWDTSQGAPPPLPAKNDIGEQLRRLSGPHASSEPYPDTPVDNNLTDSQRSTGIGHRGFQQARRSVHVDTPPEIYELPGSEPASPIGLRASSPGPLLITPDMGHPLTSPNMLSIPNLDRFSAGSEYSDPSTPTNNRDSRVDSARHKPSSSCDSNDSVTKPLPPLPTNRHSTASLSNVPELAHSTKATPSLRECTEPTTPVMDQGRMANSPTKAPDSAPELDRSPSALLSRAILQAPLPPLPTSRHSTISLSSVSDSKSTSSPNEVTEPGISPVMDQGSALESSVEGPDSATGLTGRISMFSDRAIMQTGSEVQRTRPTSADGSKGCTPGYGDEEPMTWI